MIGKVYIVNSKTNKVALTVNSTELDYNMELRKRIKNNYLNKDYFTIKCGCNKDIELNIDSLNRIYHKKNSDIKKHNKLCPRNTFNKDALFDNGWKESLDSLEVSSMLELSFTKKHSSNIKLEDFTKILNSYVWNNNMYSTNTFPIDKYDFLTKVYIASKNIRIKNISNKSLRELYFNINDFKNNIREHKFIYMYIHKIEDSLMKDKIKVVCEYNHNKYFNFYTNKKEFMDSYNKLKKIAKGSSIIISGFSNKVKNHMYISDFSLHLVSSNGLICKDYNEVKLFNYFYKNEIKFIKPYKPIMIYNGHKPTAIILGSSQIDIYVEIFSKSSESELLNRSKIINYMKYNLSKSHKLVFWDAYKSSNLPSVKYINSLINNDRKIKK